MDNIKNLINQYKKIRTQLLTFGYVNYIIGWDSETIAPVNCFADRAIYCEQLSQMEEKIKRSSKYQKIIFSLYEHINELDSDMQVEIKKAYKNLKKSLLVPSKLVSSYVGLLSKAGQIWAQAKVSNDYDSFKGTLKEIINYQKQIIKYTSNEKLNGYNVCLDDFEEGMNQTRYDEFFNLLKEELVPLIKKINNLKLTVPSWTKQLFDINKQKEFCSYLQSVMNLSSDKFYMSESEHPFTSGWGSNDVRITNHFHEDLLLSSIFSAIHEMGHATYEAQCDDKYDNTYLSGGTTMAMHESQSRFYENIVGRSYAFWEKHYPKLQSLFNEQLKDVTLDEFYKYANFVECSLIRTEADELTYPMHVLIRYEIEKELFNNETFDIDELPNKWNLLYEEYLGVKVPSNKEGILQDSHWAGGAFGYFPTYALGSAYGAQLYYAMQKDFNVDEAFKEDKLLTVNKWLKEHVHQYAASLTPDEILLNATGEAFNPHYYVQYLKDKFERIYQL